MYTLIPFGVFNTITYIGRRRFIRVDCHNASEITVLEAALPLSRHALDRVPFQSSPNLDLFDLKHDNATMSLDKSNNLINSRLATERSETVDFSIKFIVSNSNRLLTTYNK